MTTNTPTPELSLVLYITDQWFSSSCKNLLRTFNQLDLYQYGITSLEVTCVTTLTKEQREFFRIHGVPLAVIYNKGKELKRLKGLVTKEELQEFLTVEVKDAD